LGLQISTEICSLLTSVYLEIIEIEVRRFFVAIFLLFFVNYKVIAEKNADSIEKSFFELLWGPYDVKIFSITAEVKKIFFLFSAI
jgi:hypothetical protein